MFLYHAILTNTIPIYSCSHTTIKAFYITCSRECRDSDGCGISWSSSSVGSHREDELSSLLQIILCCETSLLTSGVHSGLRVRRGNWCIPNLIGNNDSIRHQWWTPSDCDIGLSWRCMNGRNCTRNYGIVREMIVMRH